MPNIIGAQTIRDTALPSGIDADIITAFRMREGSTYGDFLNRASVAIGAKNQELLDKWGWLIGLNPEPDVMYEDGTTAEASKRVTDIDDFEIVGGSDNGHMLPLWLHGKSAGGSWKYFQRTNEYRIRATIGKIVNDHARRFEIDLLTRWFTNTENAVGGGYDVPFVRGSGGTVKYIPRSWGGNNFGVSHNHYFGVDSDSKGFEDLLEELVFHLVEHGYEAPFDALVSATDVQAGSYRALTNFVQIVDPVVSLIDRGGATSGSQMFAYGQSGYGRIGYYQSKNGLVNLHQSPLLPTKYAGVVKSAGQLSENNPLHVRLPEEGFGMYILTDPSGREDFPIRLIRVPFEFGVGTGPERERGAAAFLDASGNWSNASIS